MVRSDGTVNRDVWAIGDAAIIDGNPLPATAQGIVRLQHPSLYLIYFLVANQKGLYLVKKLNRLSDNKSLGKPFEFHNLGSLAYLGNW